MSTLWETYRAGTHYSVRTAGRSVRLYSNGVFHSQWNPHRPFAGAVWDCLSLPALYRPPQQCKRVLLLGLGGGAGVRQLQTLVNFDYLKAIEIDPVHISIARRWFGINSKKISIVNADAIDWLHNYEGEGFDLVIDDLFGHDDNEPMRAQPLNSKWVTALKRVLNADGIVVTNCITRGELVQAAPVFSRAGFVQGYRWSLPEYENAIGVFFTRPVQANEWLHNLEASSLSPAMKRAARWVIRRSLKM